MAFRGETIQILRKLTARRVWNIFRTWSSFYLSRWTGSAIHPGMPVSISIEPTTACNLGCPECPSGLRSFTRETGNLRDDNLRRWLDELAPSLMYINFYFQGEPFIHPRFLEHVSYASQKGIYTSTSTNAHFLDEDTARRTVESGLDRLIISIDGTTQEVYSQYRINGQLDKVISGARNVVKWKKALKSRTPHIIFQFLVVAPNEHQTGDVLQLGREIGVDEVRFKTAQVYDYHNGNKLIPSNDRYSRYRRKSDGTWEVKSTLDNHCWRMWSGSVITWNGLVVPCCFDKDARHQFGNLTKESFRIIWNNEAYRSFRQQIFRSRKSIDICANCSEGTRVWA